VWHFGAAPWFAGRTLTAHLALARIEMARHIGKLAAFDGQPADALACGCLDVRKWFADCLSRTGCPFGRALMLRFDLWLCFACARTTFQIHANGVLKKPNAQVNRQKCEAFLSALNLQLGWCAQAELVAWPWPENLCRRLTIA